MILGRYKLVYSKDGGVEWLFDLENDPGEQKPIVDKATTSIFVQKLLQILSDTEGRREKEDTRNA